MLSIIYRLENVPDTKTFSGTVRQEIEVWKIQEESNLTLVLKTISERVRG